MKTKLMIIGMLIVLLGFVFCGKDSTGPESGGPDARTAFSLTLHNIASVVPNFVQVMFQVLDGDAHGKSGLASADFNVLEDQEAVPSFVVQTSAAVDYQLKTFLVIDNSPGSDLDAIKSAAGQIINNMFSNQSIAIMALGDVYPFYYDFSDNSLMLSVALLNLQTGGARRNIYGSVYSAFTEYADVYTAREVVQYTMVLITTGADSLGAVSLQAALEARGNSAVWVVGMGTGVNSGDLEQIGNAAVVKARNSSELVEAVGDVQEQLASYPGGFYTIRYSSDTRGGANHTVDISLLQNTNTGAGSSVAGQFNSGNFYSVASGIYVNMTERYPSGLDTVWVMTGVNAPLFVITADAAELPEYTWQPGNPDVISVDVNTVNSSLATVTATGTDGQSTTLVIEDVSNGIQKTVTVMVVDYLAGYILREYWEGIEGFSVDDLIAYPDYPDNPTLSEWITSFECPSNIGDNYGTRVRGYVVPPASGDYTFWIASDDYSELWLSANKNPDNKVKIAFVEGWNNIHEWGKYEAQQSDPISLVGGQAYYIEAIWKEGTGGDNLAVAWQGPGIDQAVIGGEYLGPVIQYE